MEKDFLDTIELVQEQKKYENSLNSILWGSVEVRERGESKYIYLHRRVGKISRTIYAGEYSEELEKEIMQNNEKAKLIKKNMRKINNELKKHGYVIGEINERIKRNIDFAKRNLVDTIYKQAVLEGVAVTFLDTETIIEGGKVNNVSVNDVQKINNLKHAWQFVLDEGVITTNSNYNILCMINHLIEEGFYYSTGKLRDVPVAIGGTKWKPEIPIESDVKDELNEILSVTNVYDKAIRALLYVTKKQLFIDGNKRTAVIFANHILVSNGAGIIVIPEDKVEQYKKLLIDYYETDNTDEITKFLENECLTKI